MFCRKTKQIKTERRKYQKDVLLNKYFAGNKYKN